MFNSYDRFVEDGMNAGIPETKTTENCENKNIFVQSFNPMLGKMEWKAQPENYDYHQEIARAAFADMLHDSERNKLYYEGLKSAIQRKREACEKVHVLDIGTGTGLLAMMAAKLGADKITAIEEFGPMYECAKRVIAANGYSDKIKVIRKRSTEVVVASELDAESSDNYDMDERANILVTEVFDTELIGEAAIATFNHAHQYLLTNNCIVVPCEGTIYAQVVSSDLVARWDSLHPINVGESVTLSSCENASEQSHSLALHDLQLSQLDTDNFKPITRPIPVFHFDFNSADGNRIPTERQTIKNTVTLNSGKCDAVFMWWDISMDLDKKYILSCAPKWIHPAKDALPWRDHWMQAIYYPISHLSVDIHIDKEIRIISNHDEYCLWFDVTKNISGDINQIAMPFPKTGIHSCVSRMRLGQINDSSRNQKYVTSLRKLVEIYKAKYNKLPLNVLCISELTLLPFIAAVILSEYETKKDNIKSTIHVYEGNRQMLNFLKLFERKNKESLANVELIYHSVSITEAKNTDMCSEIDMIIGEPNFSASLLPWHNLLFWFSLQKVMFSQVHLNENQFKENKVNEQEIVQGSKSKFVMPIKAILRGVAVHYHDLWKIRAPLHTVEGFNMKPFDDLIMDACRKSDEDVEPHPLWEYPCIAVGNPEDLMKFELQSLVPNQKFLQKVKLSVEPSEKRTVNANGIALWIDWYLDEDTVVSDGPTERIIVGNDITWTKHSKQGVFLLSHLNNSSIDCNKDIHLNVVFDPEEGDLKFVLE